MSARDEKPGRKDPEAEAIVKAIVDALDGDADETREYRPVTVAAAAQRLAIKEQLRELAKLAYVGSEKPPAAPTPAPEAAPPGVASAPRPAAPRLPAAPGSSIPADRTLQLGPIAPAFADALAARAERPVTRLRWALVLATLTVALPAGLLLSPAPAPKLPAAAVAEPASESPTLDAGSSTPEVTPDVVAPPPASVSAPRPGRHLRGTSTRKAAATDAETVP